jgi:hypothetical protein
MEISRLAAIAMLCAAAVACGGATRPRPPVLEPSASGAEDVLPTADAERIVERWFEQAHGFDALEAYELEGFDQRIAFALARRWDGEGVKVLTWVVKPKVLDEVAFLILRAPGRGADVFSYATPKLYDRPVLGGGPVPRTVFRVPAVGAGLGLGSATAVAAEVTSPILPKEFLHARLGEQEVEGELCTVIESRPGVRMRGLTRVELSISQRTAAALRTVYYRGEVEVRRVRVSPQDVRRYGSRWLPARRRVWTADGREAEIVLRNVLVDPGLPKGLFTKHTLRVQRFPSF